jgi:hypothetical protein
MSTAVFDLLPVALIRIQLRDRIQSSMGEMELEPRMVVPGDPLGSTVCQVCVLCAPCGVPFYTMSCYAFKGILVALHAVLLASVG